MEKLEFKMRFGDYECVACPKRLARFHDNEQNETINFVRHYQHNGNDLVYSIGYFWYNDHEPCWELKFVGDRFAEVPDEDVKNVWYMLKAAYMCLNEWSKQNAEE